MDAMKSNVNLYHPWTAITQVMEFDHGSLIPRHPTRPRLLVASVELPDSGCKLYRLAPVQKRNGYIKKGRTERLN